MQRGRLVILIAAATASLGLLFPFFTAPIVGDVGVSATNAIPLAALCLAGIAAISGDRGESLTGLPAIAAASAVATAAVVTGALLIDALLALRDANALQIQSAIGAGLWLTAIATTIGIGGLVAGMSRRLN